MSTTKARKNNDRTESTSMKVKGTDPNWLANYIETDDSMQGMDEYRIVPRIKVIQSMTDNELKKKFGEGSAILRPGDALLWNAEQEPFKFVPVFFCVEFTKWADLRDNSEGSIIDRSYDPTSVLAKNSRDSNKREELYEGHETKKKESDKFYYRYVEHLRFFGVVYGDHPLAGTIATLSFERGEFGQGKNFISAIRMRKTRIDNRYLPVPLWSQVWELTVGFRDKGDKKWYGIDFYPPATNTIHADEAGEFNSLHKEMKELFEAQRLLVDDEDDSSTVSVDVENSEY